jgi:hypothetical protein
MLSGCQEPTSGYSTPGLLSHHSSCLGPGYWPRPTGLLSAIHMKQAYGARCSVDSHDQIVLKSGARFKDLWPSELR